MSLKELAEQMRELVEGTPYTLPEVVNLIKAEDEQWIPEEIMSYAVAIEYLHRTDGSKELSFLRGKYDRLLDDLKEKYSEDSEDAWKYRDLKK